MNPQFLLPLIIVVFAVPLFLSTRKQKRMQQQQQSMQSSLSPGDRVMTTSGLYATVVSITDDTIDLELAPGVVTTWLRAAVREKVEITADAVDEVDDDADSAEFAEDVTEEHAANVSAELEDSSEKAR